MTTQKSKLAACQQTLKELSHQKQQVIDELAALMQEVPELATMTARFVARHSFLVN